MTDYAREKRLEKKREYYKKWRAEHTESVKAAQMRYWAKKAEEMRNAAANADNIERRSAEQ